MECTQIRNLKLFNGDNMEYMKDIPDSYYDLAIVDPPYGIGMSVISKSTSKHGGRKEYKEKGWDYKTPEQSYFDELFRVSRNQIVWGGNYFTKFLPPSRGWIFWDKGQRICNSDGELAYTSFKRALRVITINRVELLKEGTIHCTQKPIKLYAWILKNYAKEGDKILDTHLGSGSSAIAAYNVNMGLSFDGIEIDKEYFDNSIKRIIIETRQLELF